MPQPGQSGTTLHTPPAVPDNLETFSHTGVVPTTYVQLNFSEGTSIVQANISILARQANASTSFLEPASQLGVNDLFVSVLPKLQRLAHRGPGRRVRSRYGSPGEYDEGRYGTPLIARINGIGERISVRRGFGNWVLMAEEGLAGQSNKAGDRDDARRLERLREPERGDQLRRARAPGRAGYGRVTLGLHYLHAWSQDDRGNNVLTGMLIDGSQPDAKLDIAAADLRLTLGRFGHRLRGRVVTKASNVLTLSRIVQVLNTRGGPGLIANYLGPNSKGNGDMTTIGWQYDISIGKLVSYPVPFSGDGPDLFVSMFGMVTHVNSDDHDGNGVGFAIRTAASMTT